MARITPFLKLLVPDNLDRVGRSNLFKIDALAKSGLFDSNANLRLRAPADIFLRPGNGTEGVGTLSTPNKINNVSFKANTFTLNDDIQFIGSWKLPLDKVDTTDLTLNKIADVDTSGVANGDIIKYNGTQWVSSPIGEVAGAQALTAAWANNEGNSKTFLHNFGTNNIQVQLYDNTSNRPVFVNTVVYNDINTITLNTVIAPPIGGYKVYFQEII